MRFRFLVTAFAVLALATAAEAQHRGVCGNSEETNAALVESIRAQKKVVAANPLVGRSATDIYIPVRFHPVAETSGDGRILRSYLIRQLKVLNDDFKDSGFVFYHDEIDWVDVNNTSVFTNPTNVDLMRSFKVNDAVNIFVTENADTGNQLGGTTLGFYSRQGDYVVSRKQELVALNNTLSHELGHFFSLPHTHQGWDGTEWTEAEHGNPLANCTAPNGTEIEFANRSNCDTAGDLLCDTREDYNFGFSNGQQCPFTRSVRDCNGDLVAPDETNQMGYFLSCTGYGFSPQQMEMMTANYNSNNRAYLRSTYVPVLDEITDRIENATPGGNEVASRFTDLVIDWEDIAGATHYILELGSLPGDAADQYYITQTSEVTIPNLMPNSRYGYRVYPFNETQTTTEAPVFFRFTTPLVNSVSEVSGLDRLELYPNPLSAGTVLQMSIDVSRDIDATITLTGINGTRAYSLPHAIRAGEQIINIPTQGIEPGLYIAAIETANGVSQRKIVLQ